MNLNKLFSMQEILDDRIEKQHNLHNVSLINKKILALIVELGELANETRCFKFWSKKSPSSKEVILEEYVDCLHFILSIGLYNEYLDIELNSLNYTDSNLTDLFLILNLSISNFINNQSKENYVNIFSNFLFLGKLLGFTPTDIEAAYISKNEINHERQDQGY
ncbi:dUTP diphosphatase [Clostridium sp.]|uniref:dUTP diphosphatase n=1 Tax=Clostridium sp. TaxID=1506 RepID=UPI002FCA82AE